MKNILSLAFAALVGVALTAIYYRVTPAKAPGDEPQVADKPLYWVAPMDANFRREGPGKSPMGMDLVPVYQDDSAATKDPAGTVKISPEVENNLGVRVATATLQELDTVIDTVGYVGFDEDRLIHIHPRVDGWLETLYVKTEGEAVRAGQPLYALYSPMLVAAQEELLLALERGNPRLIRAAEQRLATLDLEPTQIERLKTTRKASKTITVRAPQAGVIANLGVREGMFVKPGTALMSVGSLTEVWVIAEVFERHAGGLENGDAVTMTLDYLPGRDWQGVVDYIYPMLDSKTRTVRVRLRFANADALLKPNMFAQVRIRSAGSAPTLQVAREAVIRTGKQNRVVLALGDGRYRSVPVVLGRVGARSVEILSGLNANDRVVISAQFLLDSESSIGADLARMSGERADGVAP